jgi:HEAT repeat protein
LSREGDPVPPPNDLSALPAVRVAELAGWVGEAAVAARCAELLRGAAAADEPALLLCLGGRHARAWLAGADAEYWPRVWAARGLLYAWSPVAAPAVVAGLADAAWRVREMSAKVVGLREVGEGADGARALTDDPVPRVRTAALRAIARVGEQEHLEAVLDLLDDPEPTVRRAAEAASRALERRLDIDISRR